MKYCWKCGTKLEDNQNYCTNCGNKSNQQKAIVAQEQISKNTIADNYTYEEILTFLKNAKTLEQHKYTLERTIEYFRQSAQGLQYVDNITKEAINPMNDAIDVIFWGCVPALLVGIIIALFTRKNVFLVMGICILILLAISCCFYGCESLLNIPRKNRDKKLVAQCQQAYNERMWKVSEINKEISKYDYELQETKKLLSKMYSFNVVHIKYCSLVPIITICEYFEVGRCSSLKGERGAYNMFENELIQNTIISKLDDVVSKLDIIRDTQYLLYESIQTANRISNEIVNQNNRLIEINGNIANNTKAIAYNNKVIADNTRISAYADAFFR